MCPPTLLKNSSEPVRRSRLMWRRVLGLLHITSISSQRGRLAMNTRSSRNTINATRLFQCYILGTTRVFLWPPCSLRKIGLHPTVLPVQVVPVVLPPSCYDRYVSCGLSMQLFGKVVRRTTSPPLALAKSTVPASSPRHRMRARIRSHTYIFSSATTTTDEIEVWVTKEPSRRHAPEVSHDGVVQAAASQPLPMISDGEAIRAKYLLADFCCGMCFVIKPF